MRNVTGTLSKSQAPRPHPREREAMTKSNVLKFKLKAAGAKFKKLCQIIEDQSQQDPYECEGYLWSAKPQEWYCDKLGVSVRGLRGLIATPPVVRKCRHVNGRVTTLLRIGEPGPKTERDYVNICATIWRKRVKKGKPLDQNEVGCLWGLVKDWPKGRAIELLNLVINDWKMFMSGTHFEIGKIGGYKRYYHWPSLKVIRRFHSVAVEMLQMKEQAAGQAAFAECFVSPN